MSTVQRCTGCLDSGPRPIPYVRPAAAPLPAGPLDSLDAWYQSACETPSDLRAHLGTLRELADRCEHVSEVSSWCTPALIALAASRATRILSYAPAGKPEWRGLARLRSGFEGRTAGAGVEETDLCFIDTDQRAGVVFQFLVNLAPRTRKYLVLPFSETFGEVGDDGGPGVLPAVRQFLRENPDWKVRQFDTHDHGLMVLTRDPADRLPLPSIPAQAKNFLAHKAGQFVRGPGLLPLRVVEERLAHCYVCPFRQEGRCTRCGCYLEVVDPEGRNPLVPPSERGKPGRAWIAWLECKIGRWPALTAEEYRAAVAAVASAGS